MPFSQKKNIFSRRETAVFARKLALEIIAKKSQKASGAIVIALSGNLGAGKTTFVQSFLKVLGVKNSVISPTFVLSREYLLSRGFYKKAYHMDVYRLAAKEAGVLELKKVFKEKDAIVLIEWAEKIKKQIPKSAIWVCFQHGKKPDEREIKLC